MNWLRESPEHRDARLARRERHRQEHQQRMSAIDQRTARGRRRRPAAPPPGSLADVRRKQLNASKWAGRSAFLDAILSLFGRR